MAISFHCDHCDRKIEAKDSAGGKWGKCPSCHNKVYVPAIVEEDEQLTLAPIDEEAEKKEKQLMEETFRLTQDLLMERENGPAKSIHPPAFEISEKELTKNIILYLRQMANGDLGDADNTIKSITAYPKQAFNIIDRIALSDMPEQQLQDIPPQVLAGFIRTLRAKIN